MIGRLDKALNFIEVTGNRLPDPALLFLILTVAVWFFSWPLSFIDFNALHPVTGEPILVSNQLTDTGLARFLSGMVHTFITFPPLGVVLVALLGVGVAEHTGFIGAVLRSVLSITPGRLITPVVILAGIASHYAVDAGYVLVIPLGGILFYAAGRHPLAGIAAAFVGVSGGFSANFLIPSALDPLLQGFTQSAAALLDPDINVSILCNNVFTLVSTLLVLAVAWPITDRLIEPRLQGVEIDGDPEEMPRLKEVTATERRGMFAGLVAALTGVAVLVLWLFPEDSALRVNGRIFDFHAPAMQSIVSLIFLLFIIPGVIHGYVSGSVKSHRDIIEGMAKTMSTMGYYLVLAFFCAQFIWVFGESNIGVLLSVKGAELLKALDLPGPLTLFGIYPAGRISQSFCRVSVGEVGSNRSCIRADADANQPVTGSHPGGLSHWRLINKYYYSADAVLSPGSRVLPALCKGSRDRYASLADAALQRYPVAELVTVADVVLDSAASTGHSIDLYLALI